MNGGPASCDPGWLEWLTGVEDDLGSIEGEGDAWLQRIAGRVVQHAFLSPGAHVLDIGAGTGLLTVRAAAEVGPGGSVTAVDPDPGCLATLATRCRQKGLANVETVKGAVEHLPFPDRDFDAVVCRSVLGYSGDLHAATGEMARVLAPDGSFSLFEPLIAELSWRVDLGPLQSAFAQMEGVLAGRGAALDRVKLRAALRAAGFASFDSLVVHFTLSGAGRGEEELVREYLDDMPGQLSANRALLEAGFSAEIIQEVARAFARAVSSNQAKGLLPCLFAWGGRDTTTGETAT